MQVKLLVARASWVGNKTTMQSPKEIIDVPADEAARMVAKGQAEYVIPAPAVTVESAMEEVVTTPKRGRPIGKVETRNA